MIYLTREATPHLKRGASIINTTSVVAYRVSFSFPLEDLSLIEMEGVSFNVGLRIYQRCYSELYKEFGCTGNNVLFLPDLQV